MDEETCLSLLFISCKKLKLFSIRNVINIEAYILFGGVNVQKVSIAIIGTILLELAVFIVVGKLIGVIPTLLFVIGSAIGGFYLTKKIGTHSVRAIQSSVQQGQAPGVALIEGFLSVLGSILFIIPGFISTAVGALMLAPFTKKLFKPAIFFWIRKKMKNSQVIIYQK